MISNILYGFQHPFSQKYQGFSCLKSSNYSFQQDSNSSRKLWFSGCLKKHLFNFFQILADSCYHKKEESHCKKYVICLREVGQSYWQSYRFNWPLAIQFAISITYSALLAQTGSWPETRGNHHCLAKLSHLAIGILCTPLPCDPTIESQSSRHWGVKAKASKLSPLQTTFLPPGK